MNYDLSIMSSPLYLQDRSTALRLEPSFLRQLGRCPDFPGVKETYEDVYGETAQHTLHTSGRVSINIWRALLTELKLSIYNFESCAAAILQTRVPEIPAHVLSGVDLIEILN